MNIRRPVIKTQSNRLSHINYTTATDYVNILNPLQAGAKFISLDLSERILN